MKTLLRDTSQTQTIKKTRGGDIFCDFQKLLFRKSSFLIIISAIISFISAQSINAQTTVTWALTANQAPSSTSGTGYTAASQVVNDGTNYLRVNNYSGLQKTTGTAGAQRVSGLDAANATKLPNSFSTNHYVDYAVSAASGYNLSVSNISMNLGGGGGTGARVAIYYSTDNFSSSTAIVASGTPLSLISNSSSPYLTTYSYTSSSFAGSSNIPVNDGQTLKVRVYLWHTSTSTGKYLISNNVAITFTSSASAVAAPTTQASGITFSGVSYNTLTATWTNGDGASRAVFVKEGTSGTATPTDGETYTASADWSSKGTQIGSTGYYCVYNGTGNSVTLTNLTGSTTYNVIVFEYNGSGAASKFLTTSATNNPNTQSTTATPTFYYYRSKQTGNWSDANSWESSTDNATWGSAGGAPSGTSTDLAITVLSGHIITVDAGTATADELTVDNGATLNVASGATLSITNGSGTDLSVASGGSLILAGSFTSATSSTITVNGTFENQVNNAAFSAGSGSLTISADATYKVNGYTGSAQLTFTNVTFTSGIGSLGSTLYLTGSFSGRLPATNNGNVIINTTGGGTYLQTNPTTISGNLTIVTTTGTGINHAAGGSARNLTVSGDVTIQGGRYDIAGTGTTSGGSSSLTVNGTLTVSGGKLYLSNTTAGGTGTLNLKGNVVYTAGVIGLPSGISTGHIVFNGSTAQAVNISSTDSTLTTQNLTISNASGITLSGTKTLDVKGYLLHSVSNATFATGGLLKIVSTASSSATIYDLTNGGANTGNTISGNVTLQQWVTGQRGYRVLSNPFSTALAPSTVGTANGITITGASDVKTYNGVTNAWTGSVSSIAANTPYSVFVRGLSSEVTGLSYTTGPTAFAYNVTGALNGNSVTLNQNNSTATDWTIAGNPFAAPVKSSALTGGIAGTPYYVYTMAQNNTGTRVKAGGWVAASSVSSTTTRIPMMGVVAYQAGTSALATFSVATTSIDTTTANTIQTGLFGQGDATTQLELQLTKDGNYQDKLFVRFDANSTEKGAERMDLPKLNNDVTNIYTITSDKARLAVDARKGIDATIPVGITSPVGKYTFTVASNNFVNASNVYLIDKLTNTKTALEPGATYSFEITSNAATQGDNRFELGTVKTQVQDAIANDGFTVKVLGNVVNNAVTVQIKGAKSSSVQITVVDMQGKLISNTTSSREVNNLALASGSGMYLIKVTDGENSIVSKVVKP